LLGIIFNPSKDQIHRYTTGLTSKSK